jgi:hypothetical protein
MRLGRAVTLLALGSGWLLPTRAVAAEVEQRQGAAVARLGITPAENSRLEMRLSDELPLTLSIEGPAGLEVQPIQAVVTSRDWEVVSRTDPDRILLTSGRVRWRQRFQLSPIKPGALSFDLASLRFRDDPSTSQWQEVTWKPMVIQVTTEIVNADVSELRDITPPEEVPAAPSWWPAWVAAGLILLFIGAWFVGWRPWRRARRPAPVPPEQWAMTEFARLEALPLATEADVNCFHTQLSDILRRYLELRFQFPAPEQTTVEFLVSMRRSPDLTAEQHDLLRDFLDQCDQVKFARARPTLEKCQSTARMAWKFVEQTAARSTARCQPS